MRTDWTKETALAEVAKWNILFPLEDRTTAQGIAYSRLQVDARAHQLELSQELIDLDETALATGKDPQVVATIVLFKHAKWLGWRLVAEVLADAKRENGEATRFLESLKAQEKER